MSPSQVAAASLYSPLWLIRSAYASSHSLLGNSGTDFTLLFRPTRMRADCSAVNHARTTGFHLLVGPSSPGKDDGDVPHDVERGVRRHRCQQALPLLVHQGQADPHHDEPGDQQEI